MQADRLLGPDVSDVDGNKEERKGTVSLFNGPEPNIVGFRFPWTTRSSAGGWLAASREGKKSRLMKWASSVSLCKQR